MPSDIFSQISDVFKVANVVIEYLKRAGIKFDKSVILDHDANLLRFRYTLQLGSKTSRTEDIVRKVKGKLAKALEVDTPRPPMVTTLPNLEDVSNHVKIDSSHTSIDIAQLFEKVSSEILIVEFEQPLTQDVREALFPIPHSFRNPIYKEHKIVETPIEMVTDYAGFWHKAYDSFVIKNVKRIGGLHYLEEDLLLLFPEDVRNIIYGCRSAKLLSSEMNQELHRIANTSTGFRAFSNDPEVKEQLKRAVTTDKPKNVNIIDVRGTIRAIDIKGRSIEVPHEILYTVMLELDGKELALSAKMLMDIAQVDQIVKTLANRIF